jgi:uncharacterized protein YuzE
MLKINYDNEFDIMYISLGDPKPSYGEEEIPGLILLKDINTDEITGITIFDFKKRLEEDSLRNLDLPIKIDFEQQIVKYLF